MAIWQPEPLILLPSIIHQVEQAFFTLSEDNLNTGISFHSVKINVTSSNISLASSSASL